MNVDPWVIGVGAAAAFVLARRLAGGGRAPAELVKQRITDGATIVDVRTPGEFRGGSYPGAMNIPLNLLAARLEEIPREGTVVLYCASGLRSASAVRVLRRAGYAEVLNAGGLRHMPR